MVGRGRLFLEVGEGGGGGRLFPLLPLFPSPHLPPSPPSLPGVLLLVLCPSPRLKTSPLTQYLPPRRPAAGLLSLRARAACRRGVHRLGRVRGHGGRRQQGRGAGSGRGRGTCPYPSKALFYSPVCSSPVYRNNTLGHLLRYLSACLIITPPPPTCLPCSHFLLLPASLACAQVAVSMSVFRRRFIILSSHFAAHQVLPSGSTLPHLFKPL